MVSINTVIKKTIYKVKRDLSRASTKDSEADLFAAID
jgi:hypothetical protein